MAELVDALVSGTSIRKDVQVRVLFRAQNQSRRKSAFFILMEQDEKPVPTVIVEKACSGHKQKEKAANLRLFLFCLKRICFFCM